MHSSVFYDALSSPCTFAPLESECDAFYALLLSDRLDPPADACPAALLPDDPSMHAIFAPAAEGTTTHCLPDNDGQFVLTPELECSSYTTWGDNLDETCLQRPSSANLELPLLPLDGLDFSTICSLHVQQNGYAAMMSAPLLCLDPAVLSCPQTQGLLDSLQNISLSEITQAAPPCTLGFSPLIGQPVATSSPSDPSSCPDLDVDVYTDGNASADEYVPSSSGRSGKKRYSPYKRRAPRRAPLDAPSVSPPTSPTPSSSSSSIRACGRVRPRNVQADVSPSLFEDALTNGACMCPAPGCGHVPATRRMPDLRRHMRTHCARDRQATWVCCGVFLEDARAYGITDTSESYDYKGFTMVGGCLDGFSRKDALIRHLRNDRIPCRGDADLAERLSQG